MAADFNRARNAVRAGTKLDRGDDTMLTTGTTPLIRAGKAADIEAMKTLLGAGADVKAVTRNGVNALTAAARARRRSL